MNGLTGWRIYNGVGKTTTEMEDKMKKVKYYKKMKKGKKIWYSESWGEPLDVALPNGKILHFACEFYRGDGWYITDR